MRTSCHHQLTVADATACNGTAQGHELGRWQDGLRRTDEDLGGRVRLPRRRARGVDGPARPRRGRDRRRPAQGRGAAARQGAVLRARLRRPAGRVAGVGAAGVQRRLRRRATDAQVHFVCVGTPQKRGEYAADLRYVEARRRVAAARAAARRRSSSGSRPCRWARPRGWPSWSRPRCPARCWRGTRSSCARASPSQDTLHPDRLVYGLPEGDDGDDGARAARRGLRADRRRRHAARWSPTTPPPRW